ncbi:Mucin-associated surface protein (MASP), subgroup S020 [Trypanosoma cruzi]|nr:Mucin-associated surface protein (MASP), subgroup S020 [Trypanosoma cruzi]
MAMMTGRALLVCALCVLWCGAFVSVAEGPGEVAEAGVEIPDSQQQMADGIQREEGGTKGKQLQGKDTQNEVEQVLKQGEDQERLKKKEEEGRENQEQISLQKNAQALEEKEKSTREPAGGSLEGRKIGDGSGGRQQITVEEVGKPNEEGVLKSEEKVEVVVGKDASGVNLTASQQETSGIHTGESPGQSQKEGGKEEDDRKDKEREQHDQQQEENKRKLQEQNQMLQQQQQQKQQQDQGREHSENNQKESTKDKNGVGTNQTAITHNSDSSTAATAALRSDAGTEDTPTTNHPNRPSTEGATPPEKTSDGEAASANKYDTVPQSAGSTTAPTTNAKVGDTAKPVDNDSSSAASHTTSPLLLLFVVACAAAAAVVAA